MYHIDKLAIELRVLSTNIGDIMITTTSLAIPHWNYFLALEQDLEKISRFIEFDDKKIDCFSIEIARVLLASTSEVDVVCKQLCQATNSASKATKIKAYCDEITAAFPNMIDFQIRMPRYGLAFTPWVNWREKKAPDWWKANNKIKHERDSQYHQGNLKNALNSVAALFIMILYLYKEKAERGELVPAPQLMRV